MSIILELRGRRSPTGVPLIHPTSEHVVLANVFGVLKNFPPETVVVPWLERTTSRRYGTSTGWEFSFWEKQERPIGIMEGSTEVDLVLSSQNDLVFTEVKMDAQSSPGTTADPERNQLVRNLDIGYARAAREGKTFSLIYVTPDVAAPEIASRIRGSMAVFPVNAGVAAETITSCLYWASWASIGEAVASAYIAGTFGKCEKGFARDVLAYLTSKRLCKNALADEELFYTDELYRSLRKTDSPFVPYTFRQRNATKDGDRRNGRRNPSEHSWQGCGSETKRY
jgi:hypothetical protein